jgi:hypothetical protein
MVNRNDLEELQKHICLQFRIEIEAAFENQARTVGQERRADLQKMGNKLERDVADLKKLIEAKLSGLEERVVTLEDATATISAEITDNGGLADRIKALEVSTKDSEMAIPEEIALIDKKRCNVVIFGIPAVSHEADIKAVSDLLMGIDAMSDFSCYRIGAAESPNRPIIVRFQSASSQGQVITNAKKLKGQEQYNNISIKPDFTKRQRALNTQKEDALRADAITRNASMPIGEKNEYAWVVTGKPGNRHLAKKKK